MMNYNRTLQLDQMSVRHTSTLKTEPDSSESFIIRDIKVLLAGMDQVKELHKHDYFHILALKKGSGSKEIDFKAYEFCDHSVFFMRPGQVHKFILKAESTGYLIEFKTDYFAPPANVLKQLMCKSIDINLCHFDVKRFHKLLSILIYIFREYTAGQEGYNEVIKAALNIFFIELVRNRQNHKKTDNFTPYMLERLEEFLELLETHISDQMKVAKYADMLNLSSYQLNAITKATLGKKCSEVITDHLILESKRHLLATTDQVNQIARHLGYEDVSYYIRFFKHHTGYSPASYRGNFK